MCQGLQSVPENFAQDQNTFGDIEGNEPAENEQKDQKQQKEPEKTEQKAAQLGSADAKDEEVLPDEKEMKVPTTFNEMLLFNASVMGYGASTWMSIVLAQFDDMVRNVANFTRLQEECDVMSLVLAKYKGKILLTEFKAVTLASLRSLLPQECVVYRRLLLYAILPTLLLYATLFETKPGDLSYFARIGTPSMRSPGVGFGRTSRDSWVQC